MNGGAVPSGDRPHCRLRMPEERRYRGPRAALVGQSDGCQFAEIRFSQGQLSFPPHFLDVSP